MHIIHTILYEIDTIYLEKKKEEVREVTFNFLILAKALMISSVIPSQKYSFSLAELILTKGNTAIDLFMLYLLILNITAIDGFKIQITGYTNISNNRIFKDYKPE